MAVALVIFPVMETASKGVSEVTCKQRSYTREPLISIQWNPSTVYPSSASAVLIGPAKNPVMDG